MWSAHGDRGAKSVDQTTNTLNSLSKHQIPILHQIRSPFQYQPGALLTLTTVDLTLRRLGTPIGTIPIMLNTSIQNNPYGPSKNLLKLSQSPLPSPTQT